MKLSHAILAICLSAPAKSSYSDPCYDISKGQPASLTGLLIYKILPGSPGFNDVAKGDEPEPTFLLQLDEDICITGDPDIDDPALRFSLVHLFPDRYEKTLKHLVNHRVNVDLMNLFPNHNGHHHAPLVALVKNINTEVDITEEYGTAATVVRGFYMALGDGSGAEASKFVVAEKRNSGPLSAKALSQFYGSLKEPLKVIGVSSTGPSSFMAHYRYQSKGLICDGRAEITTTKRQGRNFIQSIKALDGC